MRNICVCSLCIGKCAFLCFCVCSFFNSWNSCWADSFCLYMQLAYLMQKSAPKCWIFRTSEDYTRLCSKGPALLLRICIVALQQMFLSLLNTKPLLRSSALHRTTHPRQKQRCFQPKCRQIKCNFFLFRCCSQKPTALTLDGLCPLTFPSASSLFHFCVARGKLSWSKLPEWSCNMQRGSRMPWN